MKVQSEMSDSIALFWENLNAVLRDIKGDESIYFNPYMFITNEAGAKFESDTKGVWATRSG